MENDKEQLSTEVDKGQEVVAEEPQTYSKDEVDKLIQLEKQKAADKVRSEYSKKLKEVETAKMSETEKKEFELKQAQDELLAKSKALRDKELELLANDLLTENGINAKFKKYVKGEDEETTKTRVKEFKMEWDSAIKEAVEAKFQNNSRSPNSSSEGLTKERINQMSMAEINANWENISKVLEK